jgi:hypothetical protein
VSDRERWIVYPLLTLAIGMSWHDKVMPTKRVLTHELIVVNDENQAVARIQATPNGDGALRLRRGGRDVDPTKVAQPARAPLLGSGPKPNNTGKQPASDDRRRPPLVQAPGWLKEILRKQALSPHSR